MRTTAIAPYVVKAPPNNQKPIAGKSRSRASSPATSSVVPGSIRSLKGCVTAPQRPVSLADMELAIARRGGAPQ